MVRRRICRANGTVQTPQRRLLAILIKHRTREREASALSDDLGLPDTYALDRTLAKLSKTASALGINVKRVYVQAKLSVKGEQIKVYRIAPGFLRIAEKHDWPSAHELKELILAK